LRISSPLAGLTILAHPSIMRRRPTPSLPSPALRQGFQCCEIVRARTRHSAATPKRCGVPGRGAQATDTGAGCVPATRRSLMRAFSHWHPHFGGDHPNAGITHMLSAITRLLTAGVESGGSGLGARLHPKIGAHGHRLRDACHAAPAGTQPSEPRTENTASAARS
jgi:hypothetical protein